MMRHRALCFAILAFALTYVFFFGGKVPYALFFTISTLIALSVLHVFAARAFTEASCSVSRREVVKGGSVDLSVRVRNRCALFLPYVQITFARPVEFECLCENESSSVGPFAQRISVARLTGKYRGLFDVNIAEVRLMDFLGLLTLRLPCGKAPDVMVYPRIVELASFPAVDQLSMDNLSNFDTAADEITDISDVRGYVDGDGLRKIHWKISARLQTLMSKNYESAAKSGVSVFIDLSPTGGGREGALMVEDMVIEAAVAVVLYFLRQRWSVRLCYFERDYVTYGVDDFVLFDVAYERLAAATFASERGVPQLVDAANFGSGERQDVCVITAAGATSSSSVPGDGVDGGVGGLGSGLGAEASQEVAAPQQPSSRQQQQQQQQQKQQAAAPDSTDRAEGGASDPVLERLEAVAEQGCQATLVRVHAGGRPASMRLWREAIYVCDIGCGDDLREVFADFERERENESAQRAFGAGA